jgi:glutamate synthase domain-containing protein 2
MKGFMFSIEMLGAISLILVIIVSMIGFSTETYTETSLFELKNTNNAIMQMYSEGPEKPVFGVEIDNIYCKEFADFDKDTNKIVEKRYCEAI